MNKLLKVACVAVVLQGCAGPNVITDSGSRGPGSGYPLVDEKMTGFNAEKYAKTDYPDCWGYATTAQNQGSAGEGAAGGALAGAALGAMTGAFLGDAGFGAAVGASYGAIGGAAGSVNGAENSASITMRNCLRGRGYNTLF